MDGRLGGLLSLVRAAASSLSNLACVLRCHRDALAASTAHELYHTLRKTPSARDKRTPATYIKVQSERLAEGVEQLDVSP